MESNRLISQFAYKIEPKPDGGFIARATDPTVAPIEAPTREEVQQKIQQNILNAISTEFPALKAAEAKKLEMAFHVERTPQGGFEIHSADPNSPVVHAPNENDLESHLLEKFLNFAGKHVLPELPQALAAQAGSANVKVVVNKKTAFRVNAGSKGITFGASKAPVRTGAAQFSQPDASNLGTIDGRPITPESSNAWKVFGLALAAMILGALMYFLFRFR